VHPLDAEAGAIFPPFRKKKKKLGKVNLTFKLNLFLISGRNENAISGLQETSHFVLLSVFI
jgi:hypothetical protein